MYKRQVNRLPGVDQVIVSATEGSIRFKLDLARGRVSRVSSVLESLGHAPDVKWYLVQGKTAGEVSNRLGINRKGLRNALLDIPGILNASLDDGRVELQRIPTDSLIVSEMTENLPDKVKEYLTSRIPMARLGNGEDVSNCAVFLASDESSFITGTELVVDGGLSAT